MASQPRPATPADYAELLRFMNGQHHLHRHLDWRDSLAWLGTQPFLITEEDQKIVSVLACPPDPLDVAWVRLFGLRNDHSPDSVWQSLFKPAWQILSMLSPQPTLVSLSLRDWYTDLLQRNGFDFHQEIVVFLYDQAPPMALPCEDGLVLRKIESTDLAQVAMIDHLAFESIWRLSEQDLAYAYRKSTYCTVMESNGEIIAYQMSSSNGFYAHLARLAVHPLMQRRRIAFRLVQDLLDTFLSQHNCWGVTLNTQHNNTASLALYHQIGFRETGEHFPVYIYQP